MQVFVFEKRFLEVRKAAIQRIDKCGKEGLCVACLTPVPVGERTLRGMHMRCYFATMRAIKSGKTTEAERVRDGKMLEAQPGGRKLSNPVSIDAEDGE